ncbi:TNF receptor-associated factor 6-like [Oscarella lobularis]|uniref:TNF receptor-associated factor 6-like n=1 Tax=Oscarella lobularis TaxID=121494 RepID=UPI003313BA25
METLRKRKRLQSVDSAGGFDAVFVALPDELTCPICGVALRDPQQTVCGHHFCGACLEPLKKDKDSFSCPLCRAELTSVRVFPDNAIKRHVMSLKVKCDEHESGCEWQGELRQLDDHPDHCQFVLLSCSLGCGKNAMRRDMDNHVKMCPRREVPCQHCNGKFEHQHMEEHYDNDCPQFPMMCPQDCGEKLVRCQKDDHVAVEGTCPNTNMKCAFEDAGCSFVGKRKDMGQHTKENLETHLTMSHLKEKKLNEKVKELNEKVKEMEKALEKANFHYHWKITNWSHHMERAKDDEGYEIDSEKVYLSVPGHRVMMMLCPNASRSSNNVGIFLYVVEGEYDDFIEWPFKLDYAFSVIDQQKNRQDKTKKFKVRGIEGFHSPDGDGYGDAEIISHEELQTRSFVKNDSLFVKLTVYV